MAHLLEEEEAAKEGGKDNRRLLTGHRCLQLQEAGRQGGEGGAGQGRGWWDGVRRVKGSGRKTRRGIGGRYFFSGPCYVLSFYENIYNTAVLELPEGDKLNDVQQDEAGCQGVHPGSPAATYRLMTRHNKKTSKSSCLPCLSKTVTLSTPFWPRGSRTYVWMITTHRQSSPQAT